MASLPKRERAKTWSQLGDVRKKVSEYEAVTAKFHYHFRREPAPFELDPKMPLNEWYLKHREGSPLQAADWEGFRDPYRLTYRTYVKGQAERETYMDNLIDDFARRNHDASLSPAWVQVLDQLYLPGRFPIHTFQMAGLYVGQMAPSSYITNAANFQAADELRRIQWTAYRAKSLSLDHSDDLASSQHTRHRWEDDAAWQPLREAVEKMLIAYDWGEAFTALNLVVKPVFDDVHNKQLAELARANGDELLGLMLADFMIDSQRSRDWSAALVKYAIEQNGANQTQLKTWADKWSPLAYQGAAGLAQLFAQAPTGLDVQTVAGQAQAAHQTFLAGCGLT